METKKKKICGKLEIRMNHKKGVSFEFDRMIIKRNEEYVFYDSENDCVLTMKADPSFVGIKLFG